MKKKDNKLKQHIHRLFYVAKEQTIRRFLLLVGFFVAIYLLLFFTMLPPGISVEPGMPSPQTIYAPRNAVDYYATNILKKEAAEAVPGVYDHIPDVLEESRLVLLSFFEEIRHTPGPVPEGDELHLLQQNITPGIPEDSLLALLRQSKENLNDLQGRMERILQEIMNQGIKEDGKQAAMKQVMQEVNLLPYSPEIKQGMERLFVSLIQPNMIYNEAATEAGREAARQAVEPIRILKNSLIIQAGEKVSEKHLAQLEALGLLSSPSHTGSYFGLFLFLVLVFTAVICYVCLFNREICTKDTHIFLLGLIVVLTLVLGVAARYFSSYLIPVAMGAMLITVLFESRLAVLFNIVFVLLLGFIVDGEWSFFVMVLLGGLVAAYSVAHFKRRSDLTRAGIYVAGVNVISIITIFLLSRGFQFAYDYLREFSIALLAGIGNGLFSAVLAIGLLPFLENAFGLTTAVSLLELADPGHPLLRKLLVEAPGTYHHSILVGNLAEAASEAIGADPLLSRVAAFYHDIGKVKRPYFFVENQFGGANPHDKISPNLSSLIIRSHVKDGLELARKAGLPLPIREIIGQHHGKSLIPFFYQKALDTTRENGEKNVPLPEEDEFRYEGPLPQTKEAAIIMLADAVEAAVRALSPSSAGKVEGVIRRIIKEKLNDGQLDEAPLTLKELDRIGDTFVHILSGLFHQRIEYPEKELRADLERGKSKNGSSGKQFAG